MTKRPINTTDTLLVQNLTEARTYIAEALHAAKCGQETHAFVAAEAALNRLRSVVSRWTLAASTCDERKANNNELGTH